MHINAIAVGNQLNIYYDDVKLVKLCEIDVKRVDVPKIWNKYETMHCKIVLDPIPISRKKIRLIVSSWIDRENSVCFVSRGLFNPLFLASSKSVLREFNYVLVLNIINIIKYYNLTERIGAHFQLLHYTKLSIIHKYSYFL